MSLDLSKSGPGESASLPVVRWVCLGVLLVAELLALTIRFDTASLAALHNWWADLLGGAHVLLQVALAVAAATFLFGGDRLWADVGRAAQGGRALPAWPLLLGHLAAMAGFTVLTAYILEGDARNSPWPDAWALAWMALAAAALALWFAAALPAANWPGFARRAAGPLAAGALIGLAAWGMGHLTDLLWAPLSRWTLWVVTRLLGAATSDVVCDPAACVVGTSAFAVRISPECSGYEGIGLVWVFVGVFLWRGRHELRFPGALLLLPAATIVIWLANAGRIVALVIVGTWVSPEAARGGFHSQAGSLIFTAVALCIVGIAQQTPGITARARPALREGKADATLAYLAPLLALVATMMITAAFTSGFDWAYPLRVAVTAAVLWCFRRSYTAFRWDWSWTAVGVGVAVFVLWLALAPTPPAGAGEAFSAALRSAPPGWAATWLVFRVLGTAVTLPLTEELAFRGFLTRRFIAADFEVVPPGRFTWLSFLASSVLFGLLHGYWLAGTMAGMAYALALYRRGRVTDAVLAHAVTNGLLAAYVLASGAWWLW